MAFEVRHRARARSELARCGSTFGLKFVSDVEEWLRELADEAERGESRISQSAKKYLERLRDDPGVLSSLEKTESDLVERARSAVGWLLHGLGVASPPLELRAAMEVFLVSTTTSAQPIDSPGVVLVLYEVDRIHKRIVVAMYPELPCTPNVPGDL